MKKILFVAVLLLLAVSEVRADRSGTVSDFVGVTSMSVVGLSNSSWTMITSAAVTTFQMPGPANPVAYFMDHAPQNGSNFLIAFTTHPVAPNTTFYGYTYRPSDVPWILSLDRNINIWGISDGSVVQQLLFQQFK